MRFLKSILILCTVYCSTSTLAMAGSDVGYKMLATFPVTFSMTAELAIGRDGCFYGPSATGGPTGGGLIYRVTPKGERKNIHFFKLDGNLPWESGNGAYPIGKMAPAHDGSIFGTTGYGGIFGYGVLFRISPEGRYSVIRHLHPRESSQRCLVASDGSIYFSQFDGGSLKTGSLSRLTLDGTYTTEYEFGTPGVSRSDVGAILNPQNPWSLFEGSDGQIYGTTIEGGVVVEVYRNDPVLLTESYGCIYRYNGNGTITTLTTGTAWVKWMRDLAQESDGGFVGVAKGGIFKLSPNGSLTLKHVLLDLATMTRATDGNLYALSTTGGRFNMGQLLRFSTGAPESLLDLPSIMASSTLNLLHGRSGHFFGIFTQGHNRLFEFLVPDLTSPNVPPFAKEDHVELKLFKRTKTSSLFRREIPVLQNDGDADGDKLAITEISSPDHGTVESDGKTITYTTSKPQADQLTYRISDGRGGSAVGRVLILPKTNPSYQGQLEGSGGQSFEVHLAITPQGRVGGQLVTGDSAQPFKGRLNIFGDLSVRFELEDAAYVLDLQAVPEFRDWKVHATLRQITMENTPTNDPLFSYSGVCLPTKLNPPLKE